MIIDELLVTVEVTHPGGRKENVVIDLLDVRESIEYEKACVGDRRDTDGVYGPESNEEPYLDEFVEVALEEILQARYGTTRQAYTILTSVEGF